MTTRKKGLRSDHVVSCLTFGLFPVRPSAAAELSTSSAEPATSPVTAAELGAALPVSCRYLHQSQSACSGSMSETAYLVVYYKAGGSELIVAILCVLSFELLSSCLSFLLLFLSFFRLFFCLLLVPAAQRCMQAQAGQVMTSYKFVAVAQVIMSNAGVGSFIERLRHVSVVTAVLHVTTHRQQIAV
jgi:hypothetical protein